MKNPTNPNLNPDKGTNKAQTSCRIQELSKGAVLVAWLKVCETHRGIGRGDTYMKARQAFQELTSAELIKRCFSHSFFWDYEGCTFICKRTKFGGHVNLRFSYDDPLNVDFSTYGDRHK